MALDGIITPSQTRHIQINIGNVLTIGVLSLLWVGFADWVTAFLATKDVPVVSPVSVGAQMYLHATAA